MSTVAASVASKLLEIKAIKLNVGNPFQWASGLNSPIYCDNRLILSHPQLRNYIKEQMKAKVWAFGEPDVIAGVATAGIAHGALLADAVEKPFIYVRASAKAHGRKNRIEGELKEGQKVLVIEDLISTGKSSLAACDVLVDGGAEIIGVMAIFTYGFESSKRAFTDKGIPLETLTNYGTMIEAALESEYINSTDRSSLEAWNKDPELWSSNYIIGNENNQ